MAGHDNTTAAPDAAALALLAFEQRILTVSCIARLLILVGESGEAFENEDLPAVGWLGDRLRECANLMRRTFSEQDGTAEGADDMP